MEIIFYVFLVTYSFINFFYIKTIILIKGFCSVELVAGLSSQGINISGGRWRFIDFTHSSLYLIDYLLFLGYGT